MSRLLLILCLLAALPMSESQVSTASAVASFVIVTSLFILLADLFPKRLGMSDKSLYLWVRLAKDSAGPGSGETAQLRAEVSRLKADLKRANEERDILKKAATYFAKLSG